MNVASAISPVSTALAVLGCAVFAFLTARAPGRRARAFSWLSGFLAIWCSALFIVEVAPSAASLRLTWMTGLLLPPVALHFAATQRRLAARPLRRAVRAAWTVSVVLFTAMALFGDAMIVAASAYLLPTLTAALGLLMTSNGRDEPGSPRFRLVAAAGAVTLLAAAVDALPLFGRPLPESWPSLAPIAAALLVASLGSSVARAELFRLRPLVAHGVALSVLALVAAAGVEMLTEAVPDGAPRLLSLWVVVLTFALLERPIRTALRSPFLRALERDGAALKAGLEGIEADLASLETEGDLLTIVERVRAVAGLGEARWERDVGESVTSWSGANHQRPLGGGRLVLPLSPPALASLEDVRGAVERFAAWCATSWDALDARAETRRREHLAKMGEMTTVLAHEIKNPLGAILGAIDLLADDVKGTRGERWCTIVGEEAKRLERTVAELLTLGRTPEPRRTPTPLVPWCAHLADVVSESVASFPIEVDFEVPDETFDWDADQLTHAVLNLALNAVDAQSGQASGRVVLRARSAPHALTLWIGDDGPGIPDDLRTRLFDPFVTTRTRGTGLGLAIARRIVHAHDGRLTLEDGGSSDAWPEAEPPRGAIFRLVLPRRGTSQTESAP